MSKTAVGEIIKELNLIDYHGSFDANTFDSCSGIEILHISINEEKLDALKHISKIKNLETLYIYILGKPENLSSLANLPILKELHIIGDFLPKDLAQIPGYIQNQTFMQTLGLSIDRITDLPANIIRFKTLSRLNLYDNLSVFTNKGIEDLSEEKLSILFNINSDNINAISISYFSNNGKLIDFEIAYLQNLYKGEILPQQFGENENDKPETGNIPFAKEFVPDFGATPEFIKPYLKSDGVIVGTQNGMNDDAIASIVGRERVIGCVVELQAELFTQGTIQRNTTRKGSWFGVGELDGQLTPRVKDVAAILGKVGRCDVTNNIYGAKWTKLIANSMTMGPFSLLGLRNFEAAALPGMFDISVKLGRESMSVGKALGYRMEPIFGLRADEFAGSSDENLVTTMKTLLSHVGGGRTAPIHDHLKGRASEIAWISGLVSCKGRELGIPTPANDAVTELDRRINRGEITMDASNYALLQAKVGTIPA
jgi:2-dehydropantoate 2-reductase